MPARIQTYHGRLAVTFSRDGEEDDRRVAESGTAAVLIAMRLLSVRDRLLPGDRLTVERGDA